jgi:hypothetical protein
MKVAINFIAGFAGNESCRNFAIWRNQNVTEGGPVLTAKNTIVGYSTMNCESRSLNKNAIPAHIRSEPSLRSYNAPSGKLVLFALHAPNICTGRNYEVTRGCFSGVDEHEREGGIAYLLNVEDSDPRSLISLHRVLGVCCLRMHLGQLILRNAKLSSSDASVDSSGYTDLARVKRIP